MKDKKEFEKELKEKCPILFKELDTSYPKYDSIRKHTEPLTAYGIECSEGWWDILFETSLKLEELNNNGYDITAVQIKEKFGELRFYISVSNKLLLPETSEDANKKVYDIIREAEDKCSRTCEYCGKPGYLDSNCSWWKTLCDECNSNRKNLRNRN